MIKEIKRKRHILKIYFDKDDCYFNLYGKRYLVSSFCDGMLSLNNFGGLSINEVISNYKGYDDYIVVEEVYE